MQANNATTNNKIRTGHVKVHQKFEDPELEAEVTFAKANGLSMPKVLPSEAPKKIADVLADAVVVDVNLPKNVKNDRAERKARSRGVSGCSIKKDGNRFEYGLDCIDLAYQRGSVSDEESSDVEAEYDEYVDHVIKYSAAEIKDIVNEYLLNGDLEDALRALEKFSITNDTINRTAKDVILLSLDGDSTKLAQGTTLIENLVMNEWLSPAALMEVLEEIAGSIDELLVDTPNISSNLAVFMAKLEEDRYLDNSNVQWLYSKYHDKEKTRECCTDALAYIKNRTLLHGKLAPSGGQVSLDVLSEQFRLVLREYLQSNDVEDACARVKDLKVPHFNHDFVYQAGLIALEKMHDSVMAQLIKLLKVMYENGTLLESCIAKGFNRLFAELGDLSYDLPAAHELAKRWVDKAREAGFVPVETVKKCPMRQRSRTLSEGPDGKLAVMDENEAPNGGVDFVSKKLAEHKLANGIVGANGGELIANGHVANGHHHA